MILVESHNLKRKSKYQSLYEDIDSYCYASKNLRNYTNYIIKQCSRIHYKLKRGEILDSWEKYFILKINKALHEYNIGRKKLLAYIDDLNGFVADPYFLSWYLKSFEVYKQMPMATTAQICIQMICKDWKAFYKGMETWKKNPNSMLGNPKTPNYYDKDAGRNCIVLTNQLVSINNDNTLKFPKVFSGLYVKVRHEDIQQVRIITNLHGIQIDVYYKIANVEKSTNTDAMSIDLGLKNLATITFSNNATPVIINGKALKSINQYYNKKKAKLQIISKIANNKEKTCRSMQLTQRRNNKVKDYMHKASRIIVNLALKNNVGKIIIGNNRCWKQEISLGKVVNQNFVSIPYLTLINMIKYKAELVGIEVIVTEETYTSGTSYYDNEMPTKANYNKSRRKTRGQFVSNSGIKINADVNGSYQIMKKAKFMPPIKYNEEVRRIKVA